MRKVSDFEIDAELLIKLLTSEKHLTNLPKGATVLHVFGSERKLGIRLRVEHDGFMLTPPAGEIYWQSPIVEGDKDE